MARYYRVRLPKRVATQWANRKPSVSGDTFEDPLDPGVTFRVSDLADGRVPKESTIEPEPEVPREVGLSDAEAREMLASMAVAERSSQPDRLPVVIALVVAALFVLLASGVVQTIFSETKEQMIEERLARPRARYGWSARVGADKAKLGLPEKPAQKIDYVPIARPKFMPSLP